MAKWFPGACDRGNSRSGLCEALSGCVLPRKGGFPAGRAVGVGAGIQIGAVPAQTYHSLGISSMTKHAKCGLWRNWLAGDSDDGNPLHLGGFPAVFCDVTPFTIMGWLSTRRPWFLRRRNRQRRPDAF